MVINRILSVCSLLLLSAVVAAQEWTYGFGVFPCSTQLPYVISPNNYYLRYDAAAIQMTNMTTDEAIDGGQGGAMHTVQYWVRVSGTDTRGWLVPIRSGQRAPGPGTQYPAPYRDVAVKNRPGLTLCNVWRSENGLPDTAVCPTGVPITTYNVLVANVAGGEWLAAWPGRTGVNATVRIPQCSVPQTPTPTRTPTVPPTPVPPTPTPGPMPGWAEIEAIARCGITAGCGNDNFCPDRLMTRREVAIWLAKALDLELLPCENRFLDVPCE